MFKTELDAKFIPRTDLLMLWAPLEYYSKRYDLTIVVDTGSVSDGASIPQALWHIIGHPFSKDIREAAVLHDDIYRRLKALGLSRRQADQILYDACIELGMEEIKAQSVYMAVRAFGGSHTKGE